MQTQDINTVTPTADAGVLEMLDRFGLALDNGRVVMTDFDGSGNCYIHHSQAPVAVAGFAMVSPTFARGRFPDWSFINLIQKRPAMDETEVMAFAAVCGIAVKPPFWSRPGPFAAHLWDVIGRYHLEPFFERVERAFGNGDHYFMRPRGFDWNNAEQSELPNGLANWRAAYRKLDTPHQLMVATILQLYRQGKDQYWMVRVPKTWLAADGVDELRRAGFLADWARLYALYPGW